MKIDIVQYIQNVKQQNQQAQLDQHFVSLRKVDIDDYLIDILKESLIKRFFVIYHNMPLILYFSDFIMPCFL